MALNLSHDPIFPTQLLEESLFSSIKIDKDKNLDGFGDYLNFNKELKNPHEYRTEKNTEKVSDDIVDLLPSDPFDMNISATFTTIRGWIEDTEKDFGLTSLGFGTDETEVKTGEDDRLFAGPNLVWNGTMRFQTEGKLVGSVMDKEFQDGLCDGSFLLDGTEDILYFGYDKYWVSSSTADEYQGCTKDYCDDDGGALPDALFFAIGYLGVRDLLSVERVCKSLRDGVRSDPLLWRNIHIDRSLSDRITDDALLRLTSMAQGSLQSLSLVECLKITNDGLKRVLESNPELTKLSVAGCVKLSVEGILCSLKVFNSAGTPGVKQLRIGGLSGVTKEHFEELKFLLGADKHKELSAHKPRFYQGGYLYLSFDDERAIDIETCPRCLKLGQVYDCPAESCQGKHHTTQLCRACTSCIARCISCGCISGRDYEETFCLDFICLDCLKQLLNCQEGMGLPSKHSMFHQQARCHFCVYGYRRK